MKENYAAFVTGCLCSKYCACTEGLPWDSPGNATGLGYRLQDFGFSVQGMDHTVSGFSFRRWKRDSQEPVEVPCYASMPCFEGCSERLAALLKCYVRHGCQGATAIKDCS